MSSPPAGRSRLDNEDTIIYLRDTQEVDSPSFGHNLALHEACQDGNLQLVKNILSRSEGDINSRDELGRTPVMQAAWKGQREVFDWLVNKGADLSMVDEKNDNILHVACNQNDNIEFVKYLLTLNNVDVNVKGYHGQTPVIVAAANGYRNMFDLLKDHGADLSVADDDEDTILNVACLKDNVEFVEYLLNLNIVDINVKGEDGSTPVLQAASKGFQRLFDLLVLHGANLSVVDDENANILHHACIGGNVVIVENILSLDTPPDINSENAQRQKPVDIAKRLGNNDVFNLLVERWTRWTY